MTKNKNKKKKKNKNSKKNVMWLYRVRWCRRHVEWLWSSNYQSMKATAAVQMISRWFPRCVTSHSGKLRPLSMDQTLTQPQGNCRRGRGQWLSISMYLVSSRLHGMSTNNEFDYVFFALYFAVGLFCIWRTTNFYCNFYYYTNHPPLLCFTLDRDFPVAAPTVWNHRATIVTENAAATDISPLCPTIQSGSLRFRSFKYLSCNYISSPNKVKN